MDPRGTSGISTIPPHKPFSLLLKPASSDCNLRCAYCFYLSRRALYSSVKRHRMSQETLELTIKRFLSAPHQSSYTFCWQGGEPTLMGVEFYRRAINLQRQYCPSGSCIINTLQTNAVLLNDRFSKFLSDSMFLVGVSLDGPADIHDYYRKNILGEGVHARVIQGLECLRRNHTEFNILTLVTDANVKRGKEVYTYLRELGINYHQYIPCVEFDMRGWPAPYTISGEQWGNFLCEIYDEWIKSDTRTVSIRLFDSIITYLVTGSHDNCQMGLECCQYYVIEYNGDIYPCDFFVNSSLKLGNVQTNTWEAVGASSRYLDFGKRKAQIPIACMNCGFLAICSGDCLKHRRYSANDNGPSSWLCTGWKHFYQHALSGFIRLANQILQSRSLLS